MQFAGNLLGKFGDAFGSGIFGSLTGVDTSQGIVPGMLSEGNLIGGLAGMTGVNLGPGGVAKQVLGEKYPSSLDFDIPGLYKRPEEEEVETDPSSRILERLGNDTQKEDSTTGDFNPYQKLPYQLSDGRSLYIG